jgi:hypothetical protein
MTLGPFVANALPITWTLENVTFAGGATASGSFVYDADTNQYISRDIVFSALPATPFLFQYPQLGFDPGELDSVNSDAADLTGVGYLALIFGSILTDAGGTVALSNGFEGTCSNATCLAVALGPTVKGGSVTTATPEPATLALFPLGLFAFLRATVYRKSQGEA